MAATNVSAFKLKIKLHAKRLCSNTSLQHRMKTEFSVKTHRLCSLLFILKHFHILWSYLAGFKAEMHSFAKMLNYNIQRLIIVKQRKPLHFDIICEYGNKKRTESATVWQLKSVCGQRTGPFWEWRQTDTNRGLGTWKSLGLAGIQGESGPVVRCMGPIQLRGGGGSGMTGINSLWLRQLPRLLQRIKQWNVTGSVVFRGTVSLVTAHTRRC